MVKIRLTRTGKKHEPHYRIVATNARSKRDGKYIEKIGYYNPRTTPPTLKYDKAILEKWIDYGAQMTDTVHDIFVRENIIEQTGQRKAQVSNIIKASKAKNAPEPTEEVKAETEPKAEEAAKTTEPAQASPVEEKSE